MKSALRKAAIYSTVCRIRRRIIGNNNKTHIRATVTIPSLNNARMEVRLQPSVVVFGIYFALKMHHMRVIMLKDSCINIVKTL